MAYGGFNYFNPNQRQYVNPGQYTADANAEALRRAATMTELDKFYATMNESKRQFDIQAELEKGSQALQSRALDIEDYQFKESLAETQSEFASTMEQKESEFSRTFGLEMARLTEEGRQFDATNALGQAELAVKNKLTDQQIAALSAQIGSSQVSDTLSILAVALGGARILGGSKDSGGLGWSASDTLDTLSSFASDVWEGLGEGTEYTLDALADLLSGVDLSSYDDAGVGSIEWLTSGHYV